jgi:hypothetical protein
MPRIVASPGARVAQSGHAHRSFGREVVVANRIVTLLLLAWGAAAAAADWRPLEGTYALTAKDVIDPPPEQPRDSHLRVQLTGAAARDLWAAMKVDAVDDECTGAKARRVGDMQCLWFERDGTYECAFSIDVMAQRIEYGTPC